MSRLTACTKCGSVFPLEEMTLSKDGGILCSPCLSQAKKLFSPEESEKHKLGENEMKFKEGDKVKAIDGRDRGKTGTIEAIDEYDMVGLPYRTSYGWEAEEHLALVERAETEDTAPEAKDKADRKMREFESGATRSSLEGKLSYVKALSPIVLRRYVQYLAAHREQADGSLREFDNWKSGMPKEVYLDGLGRHFLALWWTMDGYRIQDDAGQKNEEDILCAILFNTMGMLHEILKEKGVSNWEINVK